VSDNTTPPGFTKPVATDEIGGVDFQRIKVIHGNDGINDGDVSGDNPLPTQATRTDNLLEMLQRIVKLLESNAVVDGAQRQRVSLDSIPAGVTLPTVTTVGTVTTVTTVATVSAVTNMVANAGMDREQYINVAKNVYANAIRSNLTFA
jgi:hypothetical protein